MAETKKLTPLDPVDTATLSDFNRLEGARYELAVQLLDLEQDKVRLLAASHKIDEQRKRTFERILMERGLPPDTQVQVDSTTGMLKVLTPPKPADPPKEG
jgi:hypothetical protein